MTSKSETSARKTTSETEVKFVKEMTKIELGFLGFKVFLYTWVGGAYLLLFLATFGFSQLQEPIILYGLWFSIPILFTILAFRRNHILRNGFKKPDSHRKYLDFAYGWRILVPVLTFLVMFYYFVYGFYDPRFFMLSFVTFFFFIALYMIFDGPLTQEGEIVILFELLSFSLNNFHEAQQYWKRIARKIERMLRAGNIQLSNKDLVYRFSEKLLTTDDDVSNDLTCIRDWMLGRRRSCFEALSHISSEIKLVPRQKSIFLDWILKNPDKMVKYVFAGFLVTIALALKPDSINSILTYLRSLFGV